MRKIAVVVVNYNQKRLTEECLFSIERQSLKPIKVFLVDNGSKDYDFNLGKFDLQVDLTLNKKNLGFTGGYNTGVKKALQEEIDAIMLLNNDTVPDSDCLLNLSILLFSRPNIGIVGPKIFYFEPNNLLWFAGGKINWQNPSPYFLCSHFGEREIDKGQHNQIKEADFITGAALMAKKEVWEEVGLLDENYFLFFEDADFCLRAKKQGYQILYQPEAVVWHKVAAVSGELSPGSTYYQVRNSLYFTHKWGPTWVLLKAYFFAFLLFLKNFIKIFFPSKRIYAFSQLKALKDYVLGKMGKDAVLSLPEKLIDD